MIDERKGTRQDEHKKRMLSVQRKFQAQMKTTQEEGRLFERNVVRLMRWGSGDYPVR